MAKTKVKASSPRPCSSLDILGGVKLMPAQEATSCFSCQTPLTAARIAALKTLATPLERWACVKCAKATHMPHLGVYMGEVGTSELKIVDRVYTDTVRDIFMEPDIAPEE